MDAIKFLVKEHNKVRGILKDISDKSHRYETKREMFNSLCQDLIVHETMEQKIWYPNFQNNEEVHDIVKHLVSEEKSAAATIKEFLTIKTEEKWEEKFSAFKKDVEHHASEEETKLFPKVEKILDAETLEELGEQMQEFKAEVSNSQS